MMILSTANIAKMPAADHPLRSQGRLLDNRGAMRYTGFATGSACVGRITDGTNGKVNQEGSVWR